MPDDFDAHVANARWSAIGREARRKWDEYEELKNTGDNLSAELAMDEALSLERRQREFYADCQRKIEESQPRQQPYVSQEQRAARSPSEMDARDVVDVLNNSKIGRPFTTDDYYRLRQGLNPYYATRGKEPR
jgi:hypothetical protein